MCVCELVSLVACAAVHHLLLLHLERLQDDTPGPGQYNVPSSFGQGIAFSIGSKAAPETAAKATDDIPGPGSYYNPAG